MTFEVNGFNLVPYIAFGGLKWQRADVDGPNAGRDMSGDLIRDRVATKIRWDVTCRPLTGQELSNVLTAIRPAEVTLRYTDPETNSVKTGRFYANNFPVNFAIRKKRGIEYWTGLTFPLVQY